MTEEMKQMAALGLPVSFTASEQQGKMQNLKSPLTLLPTDFNKKTTSSELSNCSVAGGNESDDDEVGQPS